MDNSIDGRLVYQASKEGYGEDFRAYALVHKHTGLFFAKGASGPVLRPFPEYRRSRKSFNYWIKRFKYPEEFEIVHTEFSPKAMVEHFVENINVD